MGDNRVNVRRGIEYFGSVGTSGTDQIVQANRFTSELTIQNTHATQSIYLSYQTTGATTSDFKLNPGDAMRISFGPANNLLGLGSGAGTTFAVFGG